jgi:NitT/TauT family transport system substrate-binding protein
VASEKLIRERPAVVTDLVRGIAQSGAWADDHRLEAARIAAPYFWQDEKILRFVLTQPPDRVSYRMLNPTDEELGKIRDMALKAGILTKAIEMKDLVDRSFIPSEIAPARLAVPNDPGRD